MANRQITQKRNHSGNLKLAVAYFDLTALNPVGATDVVKSGVWIPEGSLITRAWYHVHTSLTGGGTDAAAPKLGLTNDDDEFVATIAISATGDVWDQGAHGTLITPIMATVSGDTAILAAARNSAVMVANTVDNEIILTNVTNTITAGKLTVYVEYVQTSLLA